MNLVIVSGRLGKDAELKYTATGTAVANFSVAVYISGNKANNNIKTDWFDVTAWGNLAEKVQKTLTKGKEVTVTGKLTVEEYTNREGAKVKKVKIVAQSIGFMEDRTTGDRAERAAPKPRVEPIPDEDYPF